jgi:hypothetical protein
MEASIVDSAQRHELLHRLGILGDDPPRATAPPEPRWEGRTVLGDFEINVGKQAVEAARRERVIRRLAEMDDGQLLLWQFFGMRGADGLAREVEVR